ncbi:MAG: hypothetical protein IIX96_00360 [Clostridia bacterium]|nr:hypothetical protein [Clostridia bacterium]
MRKTKLLALLLALLCISMSLVGCSENITVDEIKEALPSLVEKSKILNEIYFGEGFKIDGSISDVKANGGYFYCDCTELELYSISEIKDFTEQIFTKEYAAVLYEAAFEGVTTDTSVEPPRYIEGEQGLMQRAADTIYSLPKREFDYNSVRVKKRSGNTVTFFISTSVDGVMSDTLTLILVREGSEGNYSYRLDSPTY